MKHDTWECLPGQESQFVSLHLLTIVPNLSLHCLFTSLYPGILFIFSFVETAPLCIWQSNSSIWRALHVCLYLIECNIKAFLACLTNLSRKSVLDYYNPISSLFQICTFANNIFYTHEIILKNL